MISSLHAVLIVAIAGGAPPAGGTGSSLSAGVGRPAQTVAVDAAPRAWVAYADQVNALVTAWLAGDEPAALEFRADLDAMRAAVEDTSQPIELRLWIDAAGAITRAEAAPVAPDGIGPDLAGLLVGRSIGTPPPAGMLLPMRLAVQLAPPPPVE